MIGRRRKLNDVFKMFKITTNLEFYPPEIICKNEVCRYLGTHTHLRELISKGAL